MTSNNLKMATWNLCLGVSNKRDYIRNTLIETRIDILNMQETELHEKTDPTQLSIKRYKLALKKSMMKIRVGMYISNNVKYRRGVDLEMQDGHMIIIDLKLKPEVRLINIYRPFKPPQGSEVKFFNKQIECLQHVITMNIIIMGDCNIDLNNRSTSTTSNIMESSA
jgi:exonuclease III